jgi:hypothetical protein
MKIPPRYLARRLINLVAVVWFAATLNFLLPRRHHLFPDCGHCSSDIFPGLDLSFVGSAYPLLETDRQDFGLRILDYFRRRRMTDGKFTARPSH